MTRWRGEDTFGSLLACADLIEHEGWSDDRLKMPSDDGDLVGLDVVLAIEHSYHKDSGDPRDAPPAALTEKVGRGELGVKTGKGFYTYPDPEFAKEGFLEGR